jgi:hypothetical protein
MMLQKIVDHYFFKKGLAVLINDFDFFDGFCKTLHIRI